MRILYFHQHFSTPEGASGLRSYWMARQLIERGHHVTIVCGSKKWGQTGLTGPFRRKVRRGQVEGINVIEFDLSYSNADSLLKRTGTFLRYALRGVWVALRADCDVVFATSTPLTASIPAICARWLRRRRFVFEVRDLWPELPRAMGAITNPIVLRLMSLLEWTSYHSAHRLIGLAPGIVKGIARRGIDRQRIKMIPNVSDVETFSRSSPTSRPEGVEEADLMAIFTGAHGVANGLDAILDAAAELKQRGRLDIKLVLVGDGKLKPALVERAQKEELYNVVFLPPMSKVEVVQLMRSADLGMQILANVPSFYYGTSPNKFFDYIATALPVLNNYPGWLADLISEHQCGFSVHPDDPKAFADALEEAASDWEELKNMGANAKELAMAQFSREKLTEWFADWLEGALKSSSRLPSYT